MRKQWYSISNMIDPKLKDKVAIVTGANHGIGAAIAKTLAEQDVKVFITYFRIGKEYTRDIEDSYKKAQASSGDSVVEKIQQAGGRAYAYESDLSKSENISAIFKRAEEDLGPVSILINNAAYCDPDTFEQNSKTVKKTGQTTNTISRESLEKHIVVNVQATALLIQEFTKRHVERNADWGRIVSISTDWAECFPTQISYGATKAALESLTRSAAVELGTHGITANIVAPGPIQTGWMSKEVETEQAKNSPLQRIGTPEDVAGVVVFLVSEQARWVTGQRLFVGGGNRVI